MRTGIGLAFIGLGAILAFAVKGSPSFIDIRTAGWVIMIVGLLGLVVPPRAYGWLGRRMVRRMTYAGGRVQPVEEVPVPPYATRNPVKGRIDAGPGPEPTLLEETDIDPVLDPASPGYRRVHGHTEVVENSYEQP